MSLARSALQYLGVRAKNPPNVQLALINPSTQNDFVKGDIWLNTAADTCFMWSGDTWIAMGSGATGGVVTVTGDSGGAISPVGGNIDLLGTADQITVTGTAGTETFSIPNPFIAPGSIEATTSLTATLGDITATNGNLVLGTAGNKIEITTGANASIGTSLAMTAGTITIATTAVTASSIIIVSYNTIAGTPGSISAPVASIVAGTSFDIVSSSNTDTSTVNWWIVN
jgi:hypothetical protein